MDKKKINLIGISTLVLLLFFFLAPMAQAVPEYSFESGVPNEWSTAGGGSLVTSTRHWKDGSQALKWSWAAGSRLQGDRPSGLTAANATRGGMKIWIYNESAVNDSLVFAVGDESEILGGTQRHEFTFNLNYTGWRALWLRFREDGTNPAWTGSTVFNAIYIYAPGSGSGDLYIDNLDFEESITMERSPDFQAPYLAIAQSRFVDHWHSTYKWSQESAPAPPGSITQSQIDDFAVIKARYLDFILGEPLNGGGASITEQFGTTANDNLDTNGSGTETTKVSPDSGMRWGAYTTGATIQFNSSNRLRFRDAPGSGSYAYTIFPTSTPLDNIAYAVPTEIPEAIRHLARRASDSTWYISDPVAADGAFDVKSVQWTALAGSTNSNLNALADGDEAPLSLTGTTGSFASLIGGNVDGGGFYLETPPLAAGHFNLDDIVWSGGNPGMASRKANLTAIIDAGVAAYDSYNITRTVDTITGVPLFPSRDPQTPHIAEDFGAGVLWPLALDYVMRGTTASRDKFLDGLDYMYDQGWAVGSGMGNMDHQGNQTAGWLNAVLIMWDELDTTQKANNIDALDWYSEFGECYRRPFERSGQSADRLQYAEPMRLIKILLSDDTPEKVRDMDSYLGWLSNSYSPVGGWGGTLKPDFVGYHHFGVQSSTYAPPGIMASCFIAYILHGTQFAVNSASTDNLAKNLEAQRIYLNKYSMNPGIAGRTGATLNGDTALASQIPAYTFLALASGDVANSPITPLFKRLYDTSDSGVLEMLSNAETNNGKMYLNTLEAINLMDQVAAAPVSSESAPAGNWTYNWAALTAHRSNNWLATLKGWSRYVLNYETSGSSNELGWYQSHGGLQIFTEAGRLANGYDYDNGWDWNRFPGTTTANTTTADLKNRDHRFFSDRGFVGGAHLEQTNGVYALDLHDNLYGIDLISKKSWFFFDDVIVCLGSDISNNSGNDTIETTLFQGKLNAQSDAIYDNSTSPVTAFPYNNNYNSGSAWLMDAFNNGYYLPDASNLNVAKQAQSSLEPDGVTGSSGDYATAWIDHGNSPVNEQYEYAIKVQSDPATVQSFASAPSYQVLQKDSNAHIVQDNLSSTIGYAMWSASASVGQGHLKSIDAPGLVMIREAAVDQLKLSVADPDLHIDDGGNPTQDTGFLGEDAYFLNDSQPVTVQISLVGEWSISESHPDASLISSGPTETVIEFYCIDGKSVNIGLTQNAGGNNPPTFNTDPINEIDATEDATYSSTLADDADDPDVGDTLFFSKVTGPAWLTVAGDGILGGTPTNADVGLNSWTVQVDDDSAAFDQATLNITVLNTNDDPTFTADPINKPNATEDAAYSDTIAGSATDVDAGDTLTYSKVSGPAWLSVASNGALSGTPTNADVGANAFTVQVDDGNGGTDQATLNITVDAAANNPPTFTSDPINEINATEDAAYSSTIADDASDPESDPMTFSKVSGPAWLSVASNGALSGTPGAGDVGANVFTVQVTATGGSDTATLNITVDAAGGGGWSEIINDDFEAGWGNWNDGGSDARRSSNDSSYAPQGTYCVRIRDNTSTSVMTTDDLNLSAYSDVKVDFSYHARKMESSEDFWLQISTDGGSNFTTVEEWNEGDEFTNDNTYSDSVTITGYTLTSNTQIRFRCDASGNSDYIYIDEVVVSAQ
jgi:hypothetical protein